jgi:hypothetical protein
VTAITFRWLSTREGENRRDQCTLLRRQFGNSSLEIRTISRRSPTHNVQIRDSLKLITELYQGLFPPQNPATMIRTHQYHFEPGISG